MEVGRQNSTGHPWAEKILRWINLRPEESERTFLMFAFYGVTSTGLFWLEASSAALLLESYGVEGFPLIYIFSAVAGSILGFIYSWIQTVLPLRRVVVLITLLLTLPIFLFWLGLTLNFALVAMVFGMRLWWEASFFFNEVNTTIVANQLFNIREIKRTFPLISSGNLVSDVVSGFSLAIMVSVFGLKNIILLAAIMMFLGTWILYHICHLYRDSFPNLVRKRANQTQENNRTNRQAQQPEQRQYIFILIGFFVLAQILSMLLDFQYLDQLNQKLDADGIARVFGIFIGVLGIVELFIQWFVSSRAIERLGVFIIAMLPPGIIAILGLFPFLMGPVLGTSQALLVGLVLLKFLDELLRYTLLASTGPVLFQPLPDASRAQVQSLRGIAEPMSAVVAGAGIWIVIEICQRWVSESTRAQVQSHIFVVITIVAALLWLLTVFLLWSRYTAILVMSAERGQLNASGMDLRILKREIFSAVVEALDKPTTTEEDRRSCITLLRNIDPQGATDILVPKLGSLSPSLQRQILEMMLEYPNPNHLNAVHDLFDQRLHPEVLALALRYTWLSEQEPDIRQVRVYTRPEIDPVVRGTAAALMLRRGNPRQKAEATTTLQRMITHQQERERVMGCRALAEAFQIQGLQSFIPNLLQDESLRVRCALLEAIAATRLEPYYPSLLRGLQYRSTRSAAMAGLKKLGNEALPMLSELAEDFQKPDSVRAYVWETIGQIGTPEALEILISRLMSAWGTTRRNILRILVKLPQEQGIEATLNTLQRQGIEDLINQELNFSGQIYGALLDLTPERLPGRNADLLRRSLRTLQTDLAERLFLLMRFLYEPDRIQAAEFSVLTGSKNEIARGLEILDNTVDLRSKRTLLTILDLRSDREKMQSLEAWFAYAPMVPGDRVKALMELRHFLSDWSLACCFHVAREYRWGFSTEDTLACLRHPKGFVREAVLSYLEMASPRALQQLLPMIQADPDQMVAAQVKELMVATQ